MSPDGTTHDDPKAARTRATGEIARQNGSIIVFGTNTWSDYLQTRQHIARGLALRGWPVTYSTGLRYFWNRLDADWHALKWRSGSAEADGVTLDYPGRWLMRLPRAPCWDRFVRWRYAENLRRLAQWESATPRIALVFHPEFEPYLDRLEDCTVVYYADDSFSKMPGDATVFQAWERSLVERADLIVATSSGVARALPGSGTRRARVLHNGADVEFFQHESDGPCPPELARIARPRIGYCGTINPKVDLGLVAALAAHRPGWNWVFIGNVMSEALDGDPASAAAMATLGTLPNVHFLGPRPYAHLPRFQAHMDINTMCYRTDPGGWWEDVSPLKLYEYLSVGRPVIASNLESLRPLRDVLTIAVGAQAWCAAIEAELDGPGASSPAQRRAAAAEHGWDGIVARLEQWVLECRHGPASGRGQLWVSSGARRSV